MYSLAVKSQEIHAFCHEKLVYQSGRFSAVTVVGSLILDQALQRGQIKVSGILARSTRSHAQGSSSSIVTIPPRHLRLSRLHLFLGNINLRFGLFRSLIMVSCNGVGLLRAVLLLLSPHSWVTSAHATTRAMQSVKSKGRHTQGLWGHVQENESKGGWKTLGNLEVIPRLARILHRSRARRPGHRDNRGKRYLQGRHARKVPEAQGRYGA